MSVRPVGGEKKAIRGFSSDEWDNGGVAPPEVPWQQRRANAVARCTARVTPVLSGGMVLA